MSNITNRFNTAIHEFKADKCVPPLYTSQDTSLSSTTAPTQGYCVAPVRDGSASSLIDIFCGKQHVLERAIQFSESVSSATQLTDVPLASCGHLQYIMNATVTDETKDALRARYMAWLVRTLYTVATYFLLHGICCYAPMLPTTWPPNRCCGILCCSVQADVAPAKEAGAPNQALVVRNEVAASLSDDAVPRGGVNTPGHSLQHDTRTTGSGDEVKCTALTYWCTKLSMLITCAYSMASHAIVCTLNMTLTLASSACCKPNLRADNARKTSTDNAPCSYWVQLHAR